MAIAEDGEKRRLEDEARVTKVLEQMERVLGRNEKALEAAHKRDREPRAPEPSGSRSWGRWACGWS